MATLANRLRLTGFSEMLTTSRQRRENFYGYLFLTPWLLGFLGLFLGPGLFSLYLSFTKYDVLSAPEWLGLDNYIKMFSDDPLFYTSLGRTFYYAGVGVPLGVIGSMFLAILLNAKLRGLATYRTLFFMPSLVPIVASVVLWKWLLHADFGIINQWLIDLGWSDPPGWFGDRRWAIPSLIVMGLWQGLGGTRMIIFLAGLQGIPESLYEAASIDGATPLHKLRHVTIPLLTPTIFFNMVLGIIGGLQVFTAAFVATEGGPGFATTFYSLHLYRHAFDYWNMGYAATLAWFFAFVIVSITIWQLRLSRRWVFYYGS